MAMLKAALLILIEETRDPQELLRRLDGVVRANADGRCFVTATLANFDLRDGLLTLTNAGHPPTYLVRGDTVEEILLPSSPLGGLGQRYARHQVALERGDIVVWLSDGVFEGVNPQGEPFGYDRVVSALATPAALIAANGGSGGGSGAGTPGGRRTRPLAPTEISAALVRDRLLSAVAAHVGTEPPNDDRTVVVMRWGGPVGATAALAALPAGVPAALPVTAAPATLPDGGETSEPSPG
jgi:serine phosphatase RsbU (regulator of sigma subunit)